MITKYAILLFGAFPLSWPSNCYALREEFDPGEIVNKTDATFFDSKDAATNKGEQHYLRQDFYLMEVKLKL